jgi:hypothetical protein
MKNELSAIALIIDALKSGMRTNNIIKDHWIKYLEKPEKTRSVMDIIYILILLDTIGMKKKAEQTFSKILTSSSESHDRVIEMFQILFSCFGKSCIQGFYPWPILRFEHVRITIKFRCFCTLNYLKAFPIDSTNRML